MNSYLKFLLFVPIAIAVGVAAWYFYGNQEPAKQLSPEEAQRLFDVLHRFIYWKKVLREQRSRRIKSYLIGTNINLDLIVPFDELMKSYHVGNISPGSHDVISNFDEFFATMAFYFSRGAAAERFVSDKALFENLTASSLAVDHKLNIGGNAALIADTLKGHSTTDVTLMGPVGPRLRPAMKAKLASPESQDDEIHLIIEYKAGEKFNAMAAPIANRFIVHHDIANTQLIHAKEFLEAATSTEGKFDWSVWSGLHFLDSLSEMEYMPHIDLFRGFVQNRKSETPLHLELASMANVNFVRALYQDVIVHVDSIGLNDQELMYLTKCIGGPQLNSNGAVDKMIEAMVWILNNAREILKDSRGLSRIHMHSHRVHIIAQLKNTEKPGSIEYYGTAEGLLQGVYVAAVRACGSDQPFLFELSKAKLSNGTLLPHLLDQHPVLTWLESNEVIQIFAMPTILCRQPVGTVGLGDAISASALLYNTMWLKK